MWANVVQSKWTKDVASLHHQHDDVNSTIFNHYAAASTTLIAGWSIVVIMALMRFCLKRKNSSEVSCLRWLNQFFTITNWLTERTIDRNGTGSEQQHQHQHQQWWWWFHLIQILHRFTFPVLITIWYWWHCCCRGRWWSLLWRMRIIHNSLQNCN